MPHKDNVFLFKCNFLFTKMNFLKVNFNSVQCNKPVVDAFDKCIFNKTFFGYFQTIQKFI